jgi:tRNA dimethylallyltransferase
MTAREPLLVVIVGPTGSGKTALSLAIAEKFHGEIVNCDSVAVYREFEIGTAKPTAEERARAPHHLLDIVDPREPFTAGDYSRLAREKIAEISQRQHLPIVAGGTGLYLRALLEGLFEGPPRSEELREQLRAREREKGAGYLHRLLRRLDPEAAAGIHANDTPKLIRAIEVCISARERMTDLWRRGRDPLRGYRVLKIGLNPERDTLYTRLNARAAKMFDAGLIDETRRLLERYGDEARPLGSTGYAQVVQFLRGEIDRKLALWAAQQSHRNYAKRQITWFRREPAVEWLAGFGDEAEVQRQAASLIESMISLESIS